MASLLGLFAAGVIAYVFLTPPDAPAPTSGDLAVPSGQDVQFHEVVQSTPGPGGLTARFRFIAPAIARDGGTVSAEVAQKDMEWLCNHYALKRLPETGPKPAQIVISLADQPVPFGQQDPAATQFFEAFSVQDGLCIWEPF